MVIVPSENPKLFFCFLYLLLILVALLKIFFCLTIRWNENKYIFAYYSICQYKNEGILGVTNIDLGGISMNKWYLCGVFWDQENR